MTQEAIKKLARWIYSTSTERIMDEYSHLKCTTGKSIRKKNQEQKNIKNKKAHNNSVSQQ